LQVGVPCDERLQALRRRLALSAMPRQAPLTLQGLDMKMLLENPPVTDEILEEAVRRILAAGSPLKIVLSGSRARGDAGPESDLDLLIVEESDLPRYKRTARYLRVLVGVFPSKDVVVWTPQEIEAWSQVPNAFVTTALREAKTLYAR
jgi:predicted nucleotidyltransferase